MDVRDEGYRADLGAKSTPDDDLVRKIQSLGEAPDGFKEMVLERLDCLPRGHGVHDDLDKIARAGMEKNVSPENILVLFDDPVVLAKFADDIREILADLVHNDVLGPFLPEKIEPKLIADVCRMVIDYFVSHLHDGSFHAHMARGYGEIPVEQKTQAAALLSSARFQGILVNTFRSFSRVLLRMAMARQLEADPIERKRYFRQFAVTLLRASHFGEKEWTDVFHFASQHGFKGEEIMDMVVNFLGSDWERQQTHGAVEQVVGARSVEDNRPGRDFFEHCMEAAQSRHAFRDDDSADIAEHGEDHYGLPVPFDLLADFERAVTLRSRKHGSPPHSQDYVEASLKSPALLTTANERFYFDAGRNEPSVARQAFRPLDSRRLETSSWMV